MRRSLATGPVALALLLAAFLALRLPALTADPPAELVSHYQDFAFSIFDEGWWTANARHAVQTGHVLGTGFDLFWVSPVFTLLQTLAFAIGGPSLAAGRLLSIAMGALGLLLLWRAGRGEGAGRGAGTAALAAFLWTVSFAPAQLGRLAVPETSGATLGLAGALALLSRRRAGAFAAGALAGAAALVKPHFGFLVPTFLAAEVVLAIRHERSVARGAVFVVLGLAVPALVWGSIVALHARDFAELGQFYLTDRWFAGVPPELSFGVAQIKPLAQVLVAGVVYRQHFFAVLPFVFLLAVLALPRIGGAVLAPRRETGVGDAAIVFGLWAVIGGGLIATLPFQPLRYYRPLVPALVYLAAWCLTAPPPAAAPPSGEEAGAVARWRRRAVALVRWGAGAFALVQIVFAGLQSWAPAALVARSTTRVQLLHPVDFHLAPFLVGLFRDRSLDAFTALPRELAMMAALATCGAAALLAGGTVALVLARPLARGVHGLERRVPRAAVAVVVLALAWQAFQWVRWIPERAWTLPEMSREIVRLVPPDATVSPGGTYSLGTSLRFDSAAVRKGAMFDATGSCDYFVALAGHPWIGELPPGEIERRYPGSEPLATFDLTGGYVYRLYRAARPPGESGAGLSPGSAHTSGGTSPPPRTTP